MHAHTHGGECGIGRKNREAEPGGVLEGGGRGKGVLTCRRARLRSRTITAAPAAARLTSPSVRWCGGGGGVEVKGGCGPGRTALPTTAGASAHLAPPWPPSRTWLLPGPLPHPAPPQPSSRSPLLPTPLPAPAESSPPTLQSPPGCWGPREVRLAQRTKAEGGDTGRGGRACSATAPGETPTAGRGWGAVRPPPGTPPTPTPPAPLLRFPKLEPDLATTIRDALGAWEVEKGSEMESRRETGKRGMAVAGTGAGGKGGLGVWHRSAPAAPAGRSRATSALAVSPAAPWGRETLGARISAAPTSLC